MFGDGMESVVIDPHRDCQVYMDITHIFETHRNEDYVVGSEELARRIRATIHYGKPLDFSYGKGVSEGDSFMVGNLDLKILETPGYTFESISIVVTYRNYGVDSVAVFSGDTIFVGDVGRTDFYP